MRRTLFALAVSLVASRAGAQQVADSTFDTRVARPAYADRGPRVLFDEAHHNFHTSSGRYRVFADLVRHDGYRLTPGTKPFSAATLAGFDVLVISNALGAEDMGAPEAERPAFTPGECDAVRAWVSAGGALLLVADHAPMGAAARDLGARFGVDMRSAYTVDPVRGDPDSPTMVTYTPEQGLAATHPIARGRDSTERVAKVTAFTGQSLSGPADAVQLLTLSSRAEDLMVGLGEAQGDIPPEKRRPAGGRAQGLAMTVGKGRVVVLGEAAMLTAQLAGPRGLKMGMNRPGIDNRQFALNIMRWLTRVL